MTEKTQPSEQQSALLRAYQVIEKLEARLKANEQARREPIAIIGMSCRIPGAPSVEALWDMLINKREGITEVPPERWDAQAIYDPDLAVTDKMHTTRGGFIKDADKFDAPFFGISAREAEYTDPQQRLLLELAWEAMENANIPPSSLFGSNTGVFIGISGVDYDRVAVRLDLESDVRYHRANAYSGPGMALSVAGGRISYRMGFQGPNVTIDTACSSSLVAGHLACLSLRNRECDAALIGGAQLILESVSNLPLSNARMLSPDGRCKTFDARANGYARSEGCGFVMLKRLSDALAAGDNVLAVILGSGMNQDGRSSGLTAPNGAAQQALIRQILKTNGIDPARVGYVEAHGTGTSLGDPIEVGALGGVFSANHTKEDPLVIGSIKTNIGHQEAAAGVSGLIKAVLVANKREIPPILHFETPNPHIPWDELPIKVATERLPLADGKLVGVSSFGFSGTNSHMVLDAPPPQAIEPEPEQALQRPLNVLPLSGRVEGALREMAGRYQKLLEEQPDLNFADVCYTAAVGRDHFGQRLAVVARTGAEAAQKLAAFVEERDETFITGATESAGRPMVGFLCTGQGSQYVEMGRQLYETEPTFRAALDECATLLQPHMEEPLLKVLFPAEGQQSPIDQTAYTQPCLFAIEYALAQLWRSWGIEPDILIGHSVGEYVAACLAGVFSLADGLKLIAARGRLMQALPQDGLMLSVLAPIEKVLPLVEPVADKVSIAARNGPTSVVISGVRATVEQIAEQLGADGIKTKALVTSHAFHSPLMDPMLAEFGKVAETVTFAAPTIALISNVSGQIAGDEVTTPNYWVRHVREAVNFAEGMATMQQQGCTIFLETGPRPTLLGMGRQCISGDGLVWVPSLRQGRTDWEQMLESLGTLYVNGVEIDWKGYDRHAPRRKVKLPTYAFQRRTYWFPSIPGGKQDGRASQVLRPMIDTMIKSPMMEEAIFQTRFSVKALFYLSDHRIFNKIIAPGASYVEMIIQAAELAFDAEAIQVSNVVFAEPMPLEDDGERIVQVFFTPRDSSNGSGETFEVRLVSFLDYLDDHVSTHMTCQVRMLPQAAADKVEQVSLQEFKDKCYGEIHPDDLYAADKEFFYGSPYRWITNIEYGDVQALAKMNQPDTVPSVAGYTLHPCMLDSCFQMATVHLLSQNLGALMPFFIDKLNIYRRPVAGEVLWCYVEQKGELGWDTDLVLFTPEGDVIAEMTGYQSRPGKVETILGQKVWQDWLYELTWKMQPLTAQANTEAGRWIVFADQQGTARELVGHLKDHGQTCLLIAPGSDTSSSNGVLTINPTSLDDFQKLLGDALAEQPTRGILYAWGANTFSGDTVPETTHMLCTGALHLVKALVEAGGAPPVWFVTQGTQATVGTEPVQPAPAALWGFVRTASVEQGRITMTCLDLPSTPESPDFEALVTELLAGPSEGQVAYRQGKRYAARLARRQADQGPLKQAAESGQPVRLQLSEYGMLDKLRLVPVERREPGPGEVEIQVHAAGLNFRDVLNALGMLKDYYAEVLGIHSAEEVELGFECSGVISAVGEGVTNVQVGDPVIAVTETVGMIASYVTIRAHLVARKPDNITFEEAATIPLAFLTAYYGLNLKAEMKAGDRVLIHSAAGGVGQAAVQLAHAAGAEIFGTASTRKWDFLRTRGVQHVLNSRTLDFADEIPRLTDGQGVNIVLNSLNGEFIDKSFDVLGQGGRFIEIGKLGIWDQATVQERRPDVMYVPFDLGEEMNKDAQIIPRMYEAFMPLVADGTIKPLPVKTFALHNADKAFRLMQQAQHMGKVVISIVAPESALRSDGNYMITGGLGGLGLKVAEHLVAQGARHLVLTGRSGAASQEAQEAIARMEEAGATVQVVKADIGKREDVERVVAASNEQVPLRGVIHAAGVLDDGILTQQTPERFTKVMGPKVMGGWYLHTQTQYLPLDFFVNFASVSGLLGSPGQANYSSANAFLDGLAHHRRALGLPGLSFDWGSWADVGMAARTSQLAHGSGDGMGAIEPDQGVELMTELLKVGVDAVQVGVVPVNWNQYVKKYPQAHNDPFIADVLPQQRQSASDSGAKQQKHNWLQELGAAAPEERPAVMQRYVQQTVARVLGIDPSALESGDQMLIELGLDSLMSVELRNRFEEDLKASIPMERFMDNATVKSLAKTLMERTDISDIAPAAASNGAATNGATPDLTEEQQALRDLDQLAYVDQALAVVTAQNRRQIEVNGRWICDFASCNYLGLDLEPAVMQAIPPAIEKWGVHPSWTRAVASPYIYRELEAELNEHLQAPFTLVFPSVTLLHIGLMPPLVGFDGVLFQDMEAHRSIAEACALVRSYGSTIVEYKHNDLEMLERKLAAYPREKKKVIAIDGVYSMSADYAPLPEYVQLAKKYNALLYVDDAHGMGVIGENPTPEMPYGFKGNGIVRHYGLNYDNIVYVAGLSKAFSSYAAFVACDFEILDPIITSVSTIIFSGPSPTASLASALAGLQLNQQDGDERRARLFRLTHKLITGARAIGFEVQGDHFFPIVSVVIGKTAEVIEACRILWEYGILITPSVYPVVPLSRGLTRFSVTAANTDEEIDRALEGLAAVWQRLHPADEAVPMPS